MLLRDSWLDADMTSSGCQLFVVGSPRSGTTLLRNLLHGHAQIALTAYESHFLPGFLRRYGAHPPTDSTAVNELLRQFKRGSLYRKGVERGSLCPTDEELISAFGKGSWVSLLRELFDLYSDKCMQRADIWGDKTPAYVGHMDLIDAALPEARFIHIIRDPRDQALSERAIWGKSLRRSADIWRRRIVDARASDAAREGRYNEVLYEELARTPERELRRLSAWLGVEYQPTMLNSVVGSDELGQMVDAREVSSAAIGGRRAQLSARGEASIASLTGDVARPLGYDLPVALPRHLRPSQLSLLAVHDRLALALYFVRKKGLVDGLRFALGSFLDSRVVADR